MPIYVEKLRVAPIEDNTTLLSALRVLYVLTEYQVASGVRWGYPLSQLLFEVAVYWIICRDEDAVDGSVLLDLADDAVFVGLKLISYKS